MSLLNGALAFGAFAFTIPLVIHLFFRSRFRTLDWGAMHLLESVIRVNRRRMQLTNLLLLLLRCAIPILLAFCLARPVLTGFQSLAGDAPKTLVVAIDDTRSMAVTPPGEESRIESAKRQIRKVLDDLSRKDEVILVRASRIGAVPATMGASDAASALRKVSAVAGAVSTGELLDAAMDATHVGSHARKQILLVSDFQSNAVEASSLDTARRIAEEFDQQEDATLPSIDLLNLGGESDLLANVSVDEVAIASPVVVAKRSGVFTTVVRNSSDLPANDLRLIWSVDGVAMEPRMVSIDAKSSVKNRLTHTIDEPGMHVVSVAVERTDVLLEDNRRSIAVDVIEEIDVVLIDGAPRREPLQGQADYLAIALSPFAFGGDDLPDPVHAAVIRDDQVPAALDENDVRVVILAGVGRLPDEVKKSIVRFVHDGGSLVTFDGPSVKTEFFNTDWEADGDVLRFPATLGQIIGEAGTDGEQAQEAFTIDPPATQYFPWRQLARGRENPFAAVKVHAYRDMTLRGDSDAADEATSDESTQPSVVLLKTSDQAPLAIKADIGEGTVIQFAISGNDAWSNMPLRPVFLPLVQQMVLDLAGKRDDSLQPVGQPMVVTQSDWSSAISQTSESQEIQYSASTPQGELERLTPEDDGALRLTATHLPGIYRFERRQIDFENPDNTQVAHTLRIATVPASESMLADAQAERLEYLAGTLGSTVFTEIDSLRRADRTRAHGREIWRRLLVVLLIVLVVELWLQQNLASKRRVQEVAR